MYTIETPIGPIDPFCEPEMEKTDYTVLCSIEDVVERDPTKTVGLEKDTIVLKGRLLNPSTFQPFMDQQRVCRVFWKRGAGEVEYEGRGFIKSTISSRLGLESFFGDQIHLEVTFDV